MSSVGACMRIPRMIICLICFRLVHIVAGVVQLYFYYGDIKKEYLGLLII